MASNVAMTALHEIVRRVLGRVLGTDNNFFRPEGQRAPSGAANAPYATVKIYSSQLVSFDLRRWFPSDLAVAHVVPEGTVTDLVEVLETTTQFTASVQFWRDGSVDGAGRAAWGEGARDRAERLIMNLELSASIELMNSVGLGYSTASNIRDVSGVVDGNYERRAQVDLTFYFSNSAVAAINMFKTATFDIKVQQPDGHISEVSA